jgi:hypothetical protein
MKFRVLIILALTASIASGWQHETCHADDNSIAVKTSIGTTIGELHFVDIRGLKRTLTEMGRPAATVMVFTTTSCPLVRRSFPKLKELAETFRHQNVLFVVVNVGASDTVRDMAAQAIDFEVPFYFVKDSDLSAATALGVTRSPEVVVLDQSRTLRYRGRIDDQLRIGGSKPTASRNDLEEALLEVLAGKSVSIAETAVDGCDITPPVRRPARSDITWSKDVAAIVHSKCSGCHRPGTAAPFSLLTYDDVAANAEMIQTVVENETMPPWFASRSSAHFQNDASLSRDEKNMLLDWIALGRPTGELDNGPTPPEPVTAEWKIGEPDLIITMLEEHDVPETGFVPYRYAVLPYLFLSETWVEAFEIKPDNPSVVHHCNMAYVTKDGAGEDTFITGYVPGGQPMDLAHFDNGVAVRIPAGAGLGLQIHYTTTGKEERCKIRVGLRFPRRTVQKLVRHFLLDPRGWQIPPSDPAFRLEAKHTLNRNANLLGLFTHMHVRGRDMSFYADHDNKPSETLLQIPNYNFEWQLGYELKPGDKVFPKGTVIRAVAHFDNSPFNPFNPDPKATVRYGLQTVDEMFNGFVFYVDNDEALNLTVDEKTGRVRK